MHCGKYTADVSAAIFTLFVVTDLAKVTVLIADGVSCVIVMLWWLNGLENRFLGVW